MAGRRRRGSLGGAGGPFAMSNSRHAGSSRDSHAEGRSLRASGLVARNMLALVFTYFITTPIAIVVNGVMARALGANDFGAIYLATTVLTIGFLLVEWGGQGQVAREVARDRSTAASILGTGLVARLTIVAALLILVPRIADLMGYDQTVRTALFLCGIRLALVNLGSLCSAIVRGFEKVNWHARAVVFGAVADAALVLPTLLLGGGLREALMAQIAAAAVTFGLHVFLVMSLRVGRPRIEAGALRLLFGGGLGFLLLDVVLKAQPYIDASFLSSLAPHETLGWYSAASRIVGVLIFPSTTLTYALYPTLARLWNDDVPTYQTLTRLALRTVTILGVLAACGTVIFSELAVGLIYGKEGFAPAAETLAVLAAYVLLVYSSIVLGAAIGAAGRQLRWAAAQSLCPIISVLLDPILIPWFQLHHHNGALGVAVSVVVAELVMIPCGLMLLPGGVLDRTLLRSLGRSLLAALVTGAIGHQLRAVPVLAIPVMLGAYFGVLWALRELDAEVFALLRRLLLTKAQGEPTTGGAPT